MREFHKMTVTGNCYTVNQKRRFCPEGDMKQDTIKKVFQFAWDMSFGENGEHRDRRSGGTHRRKNVEIFANTFQGKLAECALYNQLRNYGFLEISEPDFDTYGLGRWDEEDFIINGHKVSVKSTKFYGNLLLLETKDWDKTGCYIHNNNRIYDFTFFVRMDPYCEQILKKAGYLDWEPKSESETAEINCCLQRLIYEKHWKYDIPGFISADELRYIIENNFVIPKNAFLNNNTKMDAENYYVQAGDMHNIDEFKRYVSQSP